MTRDDLGICIYTSRELAKVGVSRLVESAYVDGAAFISKFGLPVAMVLPLSATGMKKMYKRILKVIEENKVEDKEFVKFNKALVEFFEAIK